ncbi:MAG: hypothetical protein ACLQGP_03220 [Isosphaeraceae bacterium]
MPVTIEECRAYGIDEATIARWAEMGTFEPIDPRDDLQGEIEEVEEDVRSTEAEIEELQETLSKARVRLARLRQQLAELGPAPPDDE